MTQASDPNTQLWTFVLWDFDPLTSGPRFNWQWLGISRISSINNAEQLIQHIQKTRDRDLRVNIIVKKKALDLYQQLKQLDPEHTLLSQCHLYIQQLHSSFIDAQLTAPEAPLLSAWQQLACNSPEIRYPNYHADCWQTLGRAFADWLSHLPDEEQQALMPDTLKLEHFTPRSFVAMHTHWPLTHLPIGWLQRNKDGSLTPSGVLSVASATRLDLPDTVDDPHKRTDFFQKIDAGISQFSAQIRAWMYDNMQMATARTSGLQQAENSLPTVYLSNVDVEQGCLLLEIYLGSEQWDTGTLPTVIVNNQVLSKEDLDYTPQQQTLEIQTGLPAVYNDYCYQISDQQGTLSITVTDIGAEIDD